MPDIPYYSDSIQSVLRDLIHERTGHFYDEKSLDLMMDKLAPLVADRGFDSFLDYYYYLKYGEDVEVEWRRVASALAVNESYFWREHVALTAAAQILIPQIHLLRSGGPVRIWHAACSSGEEPYSLVIALLEAGVFRNGLVQIVATDFDEDALERARKAVYSERSFRVMPLELRQRYFYSTENNHYRPTDLVRNQIEFSYLNLMDEVSMSAMRNFDLIFCRNAFIYFSSTAIRTVVERFYSALCTPGYLFVAASESLLKITTLFNLTELGGALVYRKDD